MLHFRGRMETRLLRPESAHTKIIGMNDWNQMVWKSELFAPTTHHHLRREQGDLTLLHDFGSKGQWHLKYHRPETSW